MWKGVAACEGGRGVGRRWVGLTAGAVSRRTRGGARRRWPGKRQASVSPSERLSSTPLSVAATTRNELAISVPMPAATT